MPMLLSCFEPSPAASACWTARLCASATPPAALMSSVLGGPALRTLVSGRGFDSFGWPEASIAWSALEGVFLFSDKEGEGEGDGDGEGDVDTCGEGEVEEEGGKDSRTSSRPTLSCSCSTIFSARSKLTRCCANCL